jgi:hypothetical protein
MHLSDSLNIDRSTTLDFGNTAVTIAVTTALCPQGPYILTEEKVLVNQMVISAQEKKQAAWVCFWRQSGSLMGDMQDGLRKVRNVRYLQKYPQQRTPRKGVRNR